MKRLLRRLTRTSTNEIWFRSAHAARVASESVRFACGRETWRRSRLRSWVLPHSADLVRVHAALARSDWPRANEALGSHFLHRTPRFLIDPARRDELSLAVRNRFPSALEDAVRRADQLRAGRYDLLGYRGLTFGSADANVDWHFDPVHQRRAPVRFWSRVPYLDPRVGDHKIIWELNRHQHWLALGRAAWLTGSHAYTTAIAVELDSWLQANPPLAGINWSSMLELAFRSMSWIWAIHFLASFEHDGESTSLLDLLLGLERQLDHVERHLSVYFSPNTHLLGEGLSLYVAGRVLPELKRAANWERIGRAILIREARAQVRADGGHAERSTHYHHYALDFYLFALAVARRTDDAAADLFAAVASQLASFCRAIADDRGHLPTIGDDDGGRLFPICGRRSADASDSLWLAAALLGRPELAVSDPPEEALWMLGDDSVSRVASGPRLVPTSQLFPDSGYGVLRSQDGHGIIDAGPHGFLNAGHAHAGALSLVLSAGGHPFLIDPGTATYTMDRKLRNRFRSTAMHNTVVIDGRMQSAPAGPFHWESRAEAQIALWCPGVRVSSINQESPAADAPDTQFDYAEARHDGYRPLVHRRAVLRAPHGLWLIADHILGTGYHDADAHWHVDPSWTRDRTAADATSARFTHPDGLCAAIASTGCNRREFHGDPMSLGWCAPEYGRLVPSPTLRVSEAAEAPMSLVTAVAAGQSQVRLSVETAPVATDREDGWHRTAVTVTYGDARILALFAVFGSGDERPTERRSIQRVALSNGDFATDARVALVWFSQRGDPVSIGLVDGSVTEWTGRRAPAFALTAAGDRPL
jgi:hypothetical protein